MKSCNEHDKVDSGHNNHYHYTNFTFLFFTAKFLFIFFYSHCFIHIFYLFIFCFIFLFFCLFFFSFFFFFFFLDIEEISHKAGNYKKFSVFIRMLGAALTEEKDSVLYVDLLTSSDLELLKARKSGGVVGGIKNPSSQATVSNKRYVILTYSGKK